MKATWTVEYDPQDESEVSQVKTMQKGQSLKSILWDMDQYLRGRLKYEELTDEVDTALEAARTKLRDLCNEADVNIDED